MNIRKLKIRQFTALAVATLISFTAFAAPRELVTQIDSVELSPANIILPGTQNGMVTFRACADDCRDVEYQRARLTEETRFVVSGSRVRFADFQQGFAAIKNNRTAYALISVDLSTRTITEIHIQG